MLTTDRRTVIVTDDILGPVEFVAFEEVGNWFAYAPPTPDYPHPTLLCLAMMADGSIEHGGSPVQVTAWPEEEDGVDGAALLAKVNAWFGTLFTLNSFPGR